MWCLEAAASWKEKVDESAEEEENEYGTTAITRTEEATSRTTRGEPSSQRDHVGTRASHVVAHAGSNYFSFRVGRAPKD
ncbi:hypothetical protein NDU88_006644 [Pleurodeles waltl]|uniref:Uncharacterized protein n=1 Tax=Pleurodeles waltl TaxID=8319 RepID=A0AAV7VMI2_PLEWA|nr:hypothetical protein NDU88_006644 [Pleurodeles waltl]